MNWEYVFDKVLLAFFHCFIIYMSYFIGDHIVTYSRRNKNSPATVFEKVYFILATIFIVAIISCFFGSSQKEEDGDFIFNNNSFFIVFFTLIIPILIGIINGLSKDKKMSMDDRLKKRYENHGSKYSDEDSETDIYFKIGIEYFKQKKYSDALKIFDGSVDKGIEKTAYGWRASCLSALEFHLDAIDDYNKAIIIEPEKADLFQARSLSKREVGDFEGEISDLKEAIRLSKFDNENNRFWNNYAKQYWGYDSATDFYNWSLQMAETTSDYIKERKERQLLRRPVR